MVGFNNIGNTCYMNVILQCLLSTKCLVDYFVNGEFLQDFKKNLLQKIEKNKEINQEKYIDDAISINLYKLIREAIQKKNEESITPKGFYKIFGKKHEIFKGNEQNDCSEFFEYVINDILDEIVTNVNFFEEITITEQFKTFIDTKNDFDEKLKMKMVNKHHFSNIKKTFMDYIKSNKYFVTKYNSLVFIKKFVNGKYSFIHKLFLGSYCSIITCSKCKESTRSFDPFYTITLPIGNSNSLYECLDDFTKIEILSENNKYKCDECDEYTDAEKKVSLIMLPTYVVINIKRLTIMNKNNKSIDIPLHLNLNKYVFWDQIDIMENHDYFLYCIVCHFGNLNGGHYVSCVKKKDNWFVCNDDNVNEININEVLENNTIKKNVSMLFYEKIK